MKRLFLPMLLPVLLALSCIPVSAEKLGLPWITSFSPEEYNADTQNWAAVEDHRGILYVANNRGVLESDGLDWQLLPIGDFLAARSLAVDRHNRLFVGALGDFGYFRPNGRGELVYVSLGKKAGLDAGEIGDVVTTLALQDGIFFLSSDGLYVWENDELTVIRPTTRFHLGFAAGGRLYVRQRELGLFVLDGRELSFVSGSERYQDDRVYAMFTLEENGKLLIASRDQGFFIFDPLGQGAERFTPHDLLNAAWKKRFQKIKVSVCDRMSDGSMVFATTQDGLFVISADGALKLHLNRRSGLMDDVVYYVARDRRDNLVLCHSNGISYVETGSPFRFVNEKTGVMGMGNAAWLLSRHGSLPADSPRVLLGTYQGLFGMDLGSEGMPEFRGIPDSSEIWQVQSIRGDLLVAGNSGVSLLEAGRLHPLLRNRLALSLLDPQGAASRLLVGTFDGLVRLDFHDDRWQKGIDVAGFTQAVFNLCRGGDGSLWLHTYSGDGIYRLFLDEECSRVVTVRNYGVREGLPYQNGNVPYAGGNRIYVATRRGIFRYLPQKDRFEPDPLFQGELGDKGRVDIIHEDANGDVWVFGENVCGVFRKTGGQRFRFQAYPFSRLKHFHLGQFFEIFDRETALLAYKDGFIVFSPEIVAQEAENADFHCLIRKVVSPGGLLYGGAGMDSAQNQTGEVDELHIPKLPFKKNMLRFYFATSFIEGAKQVEFSYWLRGLDEGWSGWSRQSLSSYTNLDEGQYEFWVRARNAYGQVSSAAVFKVRILPPWYRTVWALVLFSALGILLLSAIVTFYNRHLLREKMRLERLVAEKTQELRDISLSDPLTGLRNRRFIEEVVQPEAQSFLEFKEYLLSHTDNRFSDARQSVFGIFLFDIDFFKQVNDQFGHDAGDRVLKQFAVQLKGSIRSDDHVVRWGGEEFLVILKKTVPETIQQFAEKRRLSIARHPFILDDAATRILHRTVSIGLVNFPFYPQKPDLVGFEQAVMMADLGLYHAKTKGRDRSVLIAPGERTPSPAELEKLLHSLDYGIEQGFVSLG